VSDYAGRAVAAGLSWPLPEGLTDTALEALLFVRGGPAAGARRKPEPDWASLHRELRRLCVTLMLLWQEYRAGAPEGYGYSRFCELYEEWESPAVACQASGPSGGRAAVRRLCRPDRRAGRRPHRRGAHRAGLRRRAGCVELHLGRGDLDAGAARLDARACTCT
jgi:hypothetical protein